MTYLDKLLKQYGVDSVEGLQQALGMNSKREQDDRARMSEMQAAAAKYRAPQSEEYTCATCRGMGWVKLNVGVNHPQFGKLVACTNLDCDRQAAYRRERAQKIMSDYDDMPREYAELTFESFAALHPRQRQGKELAAAAARYLAEHAQSAFWLSDVIESMSGVSGVERLEPNFDSDNAADYVERLAFFDDSGGSRERVVLPNSYGSSLVLSSPSKGVGKTGLAVAAYNALVERGYTCAFIHFPTLLDRVRRSYGSSYNGPGAETLLLPVRDADVLILDEFGVVEGKRASDHTLKIVQDNIITPRFNAYHSKPLVITTNHTQKTFVAQFDELAASRVFKMAHWLSVGGMTLRRFNHGVN